MSAWQAWVRAIIDESRESKGVEGPASWPVTYQWPLWVAAPGVLSGSSAVTLCNCPLSSSALLSDLSLVTEMKNITMSAFGKFLSSGNNHWKQQQSDFHYGWKLIYRDSAVWHDICFLLWDNRSDLASTLAMIRAHHGYTVTRSQLLPLSWNGRRVKSPFSLRLLCPCIKSKGIRGTEWTHRHMIVLAECECINLVLLSLQELLSPTAKMTELPVLRCYITARKQSQIVFSLWFDIWAKERNKKSEKRSVILCRGWKMRVTTTCILFFTVRGRW